MTEKLPNNQLSGKDINTRQSSLLAKIIQVMSQQPNHTVALWSDFRNCAEFTFQLFKG